MKRLLIVLCLPITLSAQQRQLVPALTKGYMQQVIMTLAHDSMKGRLPGTPEETASANYIATELKRTGCKPLKRKRFTTPFDYRNPDSVIVHSAGNVVAKVNTRSEHCIIITAHYDHIGYGTHHSNAPFSTAIHNGADDNASGVAMLLALSAWCNEHKSELKYDIIFAAVSAEEDGLYGSKYLLTSGCIDTAQIICNINLDMVGHLDLLRPLLTAEGAEKNAGWNNVLPADSAEGFLVIRRTVKFADGSDHCSFINAGIPAMLFSTGLTQHYHRPSDDEVTINYPGMIAIGVYLEQLIENLNRQNDPKKIFQ